MAGEAVFLRGNPPHAASAPAPYSELHAGCFCPAAEPCSPSFGCGRPAVPADQTRAGCRGPCCSFLAPSRWVCCRQAPGPGPKALQGEEVSPL